ncbi:hemerythrin domain-containing protein [Gracilibacillus dipsosauri]|uniref:Cation-binding protein n=1 Tax=Gracilibacillus dipsosauri TaxID=178340 RepID=A0A317KW24_9BACI|nr:hemerythrin domain-containing protein [Gracilibacillus dipsosauri]PWU67625.1 cation-binding protein [Gracilibacillus dipsosauri]
MWTERDLNSRNKAMKMLENEHHYLRYLMEEWHPIVLDFENDRFEEKEDAVLAFQALRNKLKDFIEPWKKHTDKEEKYFFPALGMYIGKEQGPIVSIEEEHQEIDGYIGHFFHHSRGNIEEMSYQELKKVVQDAGEAFEVIMIHFVKEETVLFPMVDKVMKIDDLQQLTANLHSLITK